MVVVLKKTDLKGNDLGMETKEFEKTWKNNLSEREKIKMTECLENRK